VRFAVDVATAVATEIGPGRTGIHISPGNPFNDIVEGDTTTLYKTLIPGLALVDLAYLHVVHSGDQDLMTWFRGAWPTSLFVNRPDRPRADIAIDVDTGLADVASVGKLALANPDLAERLKGNQPLNEPDPKSFFGGDEHGYTDYPTMAKEPTPA
jgi:N-ethylmaleimide reductase